MNILIIHTWGIGDMIMFSPILKAIQQNISNSNIDFLITSKAASFPIAKCKNINKIYFCENSIQSFVKKALELRSTNYDYIYVTTGVTPWKSALFLSLLRSKNKIGEYRERKLPFIFTKQYKFQKTEHKIVTNSLLFSDLLSQGKVENKPVFCLDDSDRTFAEDYLIEKAFDKSRKLFGIHPGCNQKYSFKRWPLEHYIELIKKLQRREDIDIIVFIGPDEKDIGAKINQATGVHCTNNLNMFQTASLLEKCHYFLNSDSGLGHVAACFDVELFIIFGPSNEKVNAPISDKCHILRGKVAPPPISEYHNLTQPPKCLTEFYPEEVYSIIEKYI